MLATTSERLKYETNFNLDTKNNQLQNKLSRNGQCYTHVSMSSYKWNKYNASMQVNAYDYIIFTCSKQG